MVLKFIQETVLAVKVTVILTFDLKKPQRFFYKMRQDHLQEIFTFQGILDGKQRTLHTLLFVKIPTIKIKVMIMTERLSLCILEIPN